MKFVDNNEEILRRLMHVISDVSYLPESLKDYFADNPRVFHHNPWCIFDDQSIERMEVQIKNLKSSIIQSKKTLKTNETAKQQLFDESIGLLDNNLLILEEIKLGISIMNLKPIQYFTTIVMAHPISKVIDLKTFCAELNEFFEKTQAICSSCWWNAHEQ